LSTSRGVSAFHLSTKDVYFVFEELSTMTAIVDPNHCGRCFRETALRKTLLGQLRAYIDCVSTLPADYWDDYAGNGELHGTQD
jgi:hypothetical protein